MMDPSRKGSQAKQQCSICFTLRKDYASRLRLSLPVLFALNLQAKKLDFRNWESKAGLLQCCKFETTPQVF